MKKILSILAFITPLLSFAQVEKGMYLVSGNISFQSNLTSDSQIITPTQVAIKQIEVMPYFGYMVSSKVAIGIVADYWKNEQTNDFPQNQFSVSKNTQESYNAGIFMRYYQPITEKFFFFAQGDITYGKGSGTTFVQSIGTVQKIDLKGTTIAVRPGISYFVSKRWAFELMLGSLKYSIAEMTVGGESKNRNGFAFNAITRGLSPGVIFTF